GGFEGRSSVVTWVFRIVLNRARTRATREGRLVGLPALMDGAPPGGRVVDLTEFKPDGHWVEAPHLWEQIDPERVVAGRQLWDHVMEAIERLPAGQRSVIILRDIEGCEAEEACTPAWHHCRKPTRAAAPRARPYSPGHRFQKSNRETGTCSR